jgi:hypothetical protein
MSYYNEDWYRVDVSPVFSTMGANPERNELRLDSLEFDDVCHQFRSYLDMFSLYTRGWLVRTFFILSKKLKLERCSSVDVRGRRKPEKKSKRLLESIHPYATQCAAPGSRDMHTHQYTTRLSVFWCPEYHATLFFFFLLKKVLLPRDAPVQQQRSCPAPAVLSAGEHRALGRPVLGRTTPYLAHISAPLSAQQSTTFSLCLRRFGFSPCRRV